MTCDESYQHSMNILFSSPFLSCPSSILFSLFGKPSFPLLSCFTSWKLFAVHDNDLKQWKMWMLPVCWTDTVQNIHGVLYKRRTCRIFRPCHCSKFWSNEILQSTRPHAHFSQLVENQKRKSDDNTIPLNQLTNVGLAQALPNKECFDDLKYMYYYHVQGAVSCQALACMVPGSYDCHCQLWFCVCWRLYIQFEIGALGSVIGKVLKFFHKVPYNNVREFYSNYLCLSVHALKAYGRHLVYS